jgi:hypothetical protein
LRIVCRIEEKYEYIGRYIFIIWWVNRRILDRKNSDRELVKVR